MRHEARVGWVRNEIVRRAHSGVDVSTLRADTLPLLRRLVPVDAVWWTLTDPDTLLFSQPVAYEVPSSAAPQFLQNEFLGDDVNKFTALARAVHPVNTLYAATGGVPELSARYRDILRPHRMGDELRLALRDRRRTWGFMCLHREAHDRAFTRDEARLLAGLGPHLAAGLRHSLLLASTGGGHDDAGVAGVLIVSPRFELVACSRSAETWMSEIDGWPESGVHALPIATVVSRLVAAEPGDPTGALVPRVRIRARTGRWLTISASRMSGTAAPANIAVVIEPARTEDVVGLMLAAYGLSAAEMNVAREVLRGSSNKEVAHALAITPLTVQQHLKGVFEKANVHSRGELLMKLQQRGGRPPA